MKKLILKWLGLDDIKSPPTKPSDHELRMLIGQAITALLNNEKENPQHNFWECVIDYDKTHNTFLREIKNAAHIPTRDEATKVCEKRLAFINEEQFLDKIVQRIRDKQL